MREGDGKNKRNKRRGDLADGGERGAILVIVVRRGVQGLCV